MLGAIIGDIVGSRFEFNNYLGTDFELFTKDSVYTDDTICTIAVADAILNNKSYKDSLIEWCQRYPSPMGGYGASFARWVHSKDHQPYNSFGNGSAMRVSSVGWLFSDLGSVLAHSCHSAEVTHDHPEGVKGAAIVTYLIHCLKREMMSKERALDIIKSFGYPLQSVKEIRKNNSFNETCQVTVPQAISCFIESNNFEEAIRLAVSIGGDSDTIAAITGSIAEAHYDIPNDIKAEAIKRLPVDMLNIYRQFNTYCNE